MKGQFSAKRWKLPMIGHSRHSPRIIGDGRHRKASPHVLGHRAAIEITFCVFLVAGQALFFSREHRIGLWLPLASVPPGIALGLLWHFLAGPERLLHAWFSQHLDRGLAGFALFFFHLIFYILLFSLAVSYPLGLLIGTFAGSMDLVREYMVYSVNPVFVLAAGSWLRWWRTASHPSP